MVARRGRVGRFSRFVVAAVSALAVVLASVSPAGAQQNGGVTVTKTANPTSLPETAGSVEFTVRVTNTTDFPGSIAALGDSVYGDLTTREGCNTAQNAAIAPRGTYSCVFKPAFMGNAKDREQVSRTTATLTLTVTSGTSVARFQDSGFGDTTITITNVLPTVTVTQSAAPSSRPAPGGTFDYTTVVTNTSGEDVTITSLDDTVYGNLANRGSCRSAVGTVLKRDTSFTCTFVGDFTGAANTSLVDEVTVTVTDDDNTSATATAAATVQITTTSTSSSTSTTRTSTSTSTSTTSTTSTTLPPDSTTSSTVGNGGGTATTLPGLSVLSGPSSEPGGELRVRGAGCTSNSRVVFFVGTSIIGEAQAGPDGSFVAEVAAPDIPPGRIELFADCGPRFVATIDLVVASQVDPGASALAVFIFFVLLALVLFRRRRIVLPSRRHRPDAEDEG